MIINTGCIREARALVERFHYSKRWPSNVQICVTAHNPGGLFGDIGEAVAACVFAVPPVRWSEDVLELSRLVRNEKQTPLTPLISFACKQAKLKGSNLLVSFADNTHSHHGGIYQAASWAYHGMRPPRIDGILVDGRFINARQCLHLYGSTFSTIGVFNRLVGVVKGREVLPHMDSGKYLYWRAMNKVGRRKATRLGLETKPYPKPDIQCGCGDQ